MCCIWQPNLFFKVRKNNTKVAFIVQCSSVIVSHEKLKNDEVLVVMDV